MQINKNKILLSIWKCENIQIYLLFPMELEKNKDLWTIPDGNREKKYFFDWFPQIENRKTEKFDPPAEKQLSYPE